MDDDEDDSGSDIGGVLVIVASWLLVICTFPFCLFFCFKVVQQYEKAVIFRSGRLKSGEPKGVFFILPCIENYMKVDTRSRVFHVPAQDILTRDSLTVAVMAVLHYKVSNPITAITAVQNAHEATKLLAQTTLRQALGQINLHDLLANRNALSAAISMTLDVATDCWGIKVERVEITDVKLPLSLQRPMAVEGEAIREAKAKIIAAEGEFKASRVLREAADTLAESPVAIQLRYLQTLTTIAAENNQTVVFPWPVELLRPSRKKKGKAKAKGKEALRRGIWEKEMLQI